MSIYAYTEDIHLSMHNQIHCQYYFEQTAINVIKTEKQVYVLFSLISTLISFCSPENKAKSSLKDWNHIIQYVFQSQWNKTRNQQKKEKWKIYKYIKIRQHTLNNQ